MSEPGFVHDVFLSYSAKDKAVVRLLAERLRADELNVWFDEWVLKPGDSIPAKNEEGLEHSRVHGAMPVGPGVRVGLGAMGRRHVPVSRPAEPRAPLHPPAARLRRHQRGFEPCRRAQTEKHSSL